MRSPHSLHAFTSRLLPLALSITGLGCSSGTDAGDATDAEVEDVAVTDGATGDSAASSDTHGGSDSRAPEGDSRVTDAAADASDVAPEASTDTRPGDAPGDLGVDTGRPEAGPITELVIMPFGDSITGEPHTYREPLYGLLTKAGCTVKLVGSQTDTYATIPQKDHEGHPGFTIGDMASSTDAWLAAHPPKYVLMMIGTNDIAWWYAGTPAQVGDAHAKLLDQLIAAAPTAWIIVASIPPQSSVIVEPNKYDRSVFATQVNTEIKKRVDTRIAAGKKVKLVDVNGALTVADLRDGIHPTVPGYAKIADVWFKALQPIAGCLGGAP